MSWKDIVKNDSKMFENMKEEIKFNLRYMGQTESLLSTFSEGDDTTYQNIRKEINEINKSLRKIEDIIKSTYKSTYTRNDRKPKNSGEVSDQEAYEQDRADVAGSRQQ